MVDMVILLYMRSLRLMSIIVFLAVCGLPILYCYLKYRPRPTEDPIKLNKNLNVVTLGTLHQLRNMNYRHKAAKSKKTDRSSVASSNSANESLIEKPADLGESVDFS
jgi:hypothetical protein